MTKYCLSPHHGGRRFCIWLLAFKFCENEFLDACFFKGYVQYHVQSVCGFLEATPIFDCVREKLYLPTSQLISFQNLC